VAKVEIVGFTKRPKGDIREAVAKAVKGRLREVEISISRVRKSLSGFEAEYGMSTERFYGRYTAGELEEKMDFMEWRACKEILDDLLGEKGLLEEIAS